MITGRELVEKMYSENYDEYEDTRLYSTGDSELDDLLEKAFCEGYEYAQKEFGNKANKKAQRTWKIKQALEENKGSKDGDYHYAKSTEIRKMRDEANRTGKLPYGIGGSGNSLSASKGNKLHKEISPDVMIDYQPKYTDYTKEESALREYREKGKKITDPIAQREINTRSTVVSNTNGEKVGGGTYEKKVSDKDLEQEQGFWDKYKKGYKVERASDKEMRDKLKDPKVKAKIAKQKFKRTVGNAKKDVSGFVKDNKKGLAIGGAALGTAALVGGGIALHKYNKKKRKEEEEKKKKSK